MKHDDLSRVDLNLLVAFNALIEEKSVSHAADRLYVTQPAMSKTLRRLRNLFDDPLFLRTAKGLEPTARAIKLQQPVSESLDRVIQLMTPPVFEPSALERNFTLAIPDPMAAALIPDLIIRLVQEAPKVRLKLRGYTGGSIHELTNGNLDFVVGLVTENVPAGLHARTLFQDKLYCLMRPDHPLAHTEELTVEALTSYEHIKPWFKGVNDEGPLDIQLKAMGGSRYIRIEASHFMTIIRTLQNTDLLLIGFGNWIRLYPRGELVSVALPETFSREVDIHLLWDDRSHIDPACCWFRSLMVDVAREGMNKASAQSDCSQS